MGEGKLQGGKEWAEKVDLGHLLVIQQSWNLSINAGDLDIQVGKKIEANMASFPTGSQVPGQVLILQKGGGVTSYFKMQANSSQAPMELGRTWLVLLLGFLWVLVSSSLVALVGEGL